jgi:hypothetical protein
VVADPERGDLPELRPPAARVQLPGDLRPAAGRELADQRSRRRVHDPQLGLELVGRITAAVDDDG